MGNTMDTTDTSTRGKPKLNLRPNPRPKLMQKLLSTTFTPLALVDTTTFTTVSPLPTPTLSIAETMDVTNKDMPMVPLPTIDTTDTTSITNKDLTTTTDIAVEVFFQMRTNGIL